MLGSYGLTLASEANCVHHMVFPKCHKTVSCVAELFIWIVQDEETEALIEESRGDMTAMLKAVHCMTLGSPGKLGWTGQCTSFGLHIMCCVIFLQGSNRHVIRQTDDVLVWINGAK